MTLFGKFIAALTTRPAFLDQNKKLQVQFDSLPDFLRHALKGQMEIPADTVKDWVDHDARFTRAAPTIEARKTITVESNVTVDLDR